MARKLCGELRDYKGETLQAFECDQIAIDLGHGKRLVLRQENIHGSQGISIFGSNDNPTANARIVLRCQGFGGVHVSVETIKK